MREWVEAQTGVARSLVGQSITGWDAIEMAIREDADGSDPQFSDPDAPCLQLSMLAILVEVGEPTVVSHYQGDTNFGFQFRRGPVPFNNWNGTDGIYRRRALKELPTGEVKSVTTRISTETMDFAELLVDIDGMELLLIAGEIEETWSERLNWRWLDESTLVFADPASASSLDWLPPRRYQEQRA